MDLTNTGRLFGSNFPHLPALPAASVVSCYFVSVSSVVLQRIRELPFLTSCVSDGSFSKEGSNSNSQVLMSSLVLIQNPDEATSIIQSRISFTRE